MTLDEFMDKMREVYEGNERDFGDFEVKVAVRNTIQDFHEVVFYPGEVVLCDETSAA